MAPSNDLREGPYLMYKVIRPVSDFSSSEMIVLETYISHHLYKLRMKNIKLDPLVYYRKYKGSTVDDPVFS